MDRNRPPPRENSYRPGDRYGGRSPPPRRGRTPPGDRAFPARGGPPYLRSSSPGRPPRYRSRSPFRPRDGPGGFRNRSPPRGPGRPRSPPPRSPLPRSPLPPRRFSRSPPPRGPPPRRSPPPSYRQRSPPPLRDGRYGGPRDDRGPRDERRDYGGYRDDGPRYPRENNYRPGEDSQSPHRGSGPASKVASADSSRMPSPHIHPDRLRQNISGSPAPRGSPAPYGSRASQGPRHSPPYRPRDRSPPPRSPPRPSYRDRPPLGPRGPRDLRDSRDPRDSPRRGSPPRRERTPPPPRPTPREPVPRDLAPRDPAPRDLASRDSVMRDSAPRDSAVKEPASRDLPSREHATRDPAPKDTATRDVQTREPGPRERSPPKGPAIERANYKDRQPTPSRDVSVPQNAPAKEQSSSWGDRAPPPGPRIRDEEPRAPPSGPRGSQYESFREGSTAGLSTPSGPASMGRGSPFTPRGRGGALFGRGRGIEPYSSPSGFGRGRGRGGFGVATPGDAPSRDSFSGPPTGPRASSWGDVGGAVPPSRPSLRGNHSSTSTYARAPRFHTHLIGMLQVIEGGRKMPSLLNPADEKRLSTLDGEREKLYKEIDERQRRKRILESEYARAEREASNARFRSDLAEQALEGLGGEGSTAAAY